VTFSRSGAACSTLGREVARQDRPWASSLDISRDLLLNLFFGGKMKACRPSSSRTMAARRDRRRYVAESDLEAYAEAKQFRSSLRPVRFAARLQRKQVKQICANGKRHAGAWTRCSARSQRACTSWTEPLDFAAVRAQRASGEGEGRSTRSASTRVSDSLNEKLKRLLVNEGRRS